MSDNKNTEAMEDHASHDWDPFRDHSELIGDLQRRIEDPTDPTSSPAVLACLGGVFVDKAKNLEAALVAPEDPSNEDGRKNERVIQAMAPVINCFKIIQDFLEAMESFPDQAAAQSCKSWSERNSTNSDDDSGFYRVVVVIVLTLTLIFSSIVQSHFRHLE